MTWARFDDDYDDNPKCRAAGKDGRALDQTAIRHCAKHATDGLIPDYDLPVLAAKAEVQAKRAMNKLVQVRRWHGPGHDCERCPECPPGHHVVHDFLEYHPSAEEDAERRRRRAEAGRKGGRKSRPKGSKSEANASALASTSAQANGKQRPKPPGSTEGTPNPNTPTEEPTSSDVLTSPADPPDDDRSDQAQLVGASLAALASRDLDARQSASHLAPVGDPVSWHNGAYDRRRERHEAELVRFANEHPDATPDELADLVEPAVAGRTASSGERVDRTYDEQQRAMLAAAEEGAAKAREVTSRPLPPDGVDRIRSIRERFPHLSVVEGA